MMAPMSPTRRMVLRLLRRWLRVGYIIFNLSAIICILLLMTAGTRIGGGDHPGTLQLNYYELALMSVRPFCLQSPARQKESKTDAVLSSTAPSTRRPALAMANLFRAATGFSTPSAGTFSSARRPIAQATSIAIQGERYGFHRSSKMSTIRCSVATHNSIGTPYSIADLIVT